MKIDLTNQVAIVTGGASGIGRGISIELARHGANVAVCDININGAIETCNILKEFGNKYIPIKVDVTNNTEVINAVEKTIKEFNHIEILCNNAGISLLKDLIDTEESEWDKMIAINLKSVFLFSKAVVSYMIKQGKGGRIINTASYLGKIGAPTLSHYCATKFGVIGFTQSIAAELGEYGITVNAICPGDVDTPMMEREWEIIGKNLGISSEEAKNINKKEMLLGRLEKPEDLGRAVVFLSSDYGEYITAEAINVSGGLPFKSRKQL